jgi:hypothetical protein
MIPADTLRFPGLLDPSAFAYKDWLHLNVFDHSTGIVGLVNLSVHGPPGGLGTQVVSAAFFDLEGEGWVGALVGGSWADAAVTLRGLSTATATLTMGAEGRVLAAFTSEKLRLRLVARPATRAVEVRGTQPFGSGWLGWRAVPRLTAEGWIELAGTRLPGGTFSAYHDHNWGRWHWGDDIGWEWGSFQAADDGSVVLATTTDRRHLRRDPFIVTLDHHDVRRTFTGARVGTRWSGAGPSPTCRTPGALAALHSDRRRPRLPGRLNVSARMGRDELELEFNCRSVAQVIIADPIVAGTSFLHQLSGRFRASGRLAGQQFEFDGLGIVERLE